VHSAFEQALSEVSENQLRTNLAALASAEMAGRGAGTPGGLLAREYVAQKFQEIGILPAVSGSYFQPFASSYGPTANVIGVLPGQDPLLMNEYVVIGAHYDHLGTSGTTIYYGADDNASGTAAVIEIAAAAYKLRNEIKRTLIFMAFDAEEKGLVGSRYYVNNPIFPIAQTVYMINLDMIGYLTRQGKILCIDGTSSPSAAAMILEIAARYPLAGTPRLDLVINGSDHSSFRSKGIPRVFFHTGTNVSPYHSPNDTWDKIDYPGVTVGTKIAFELAWRISQSEEPPLMAIVDEGLSLAENPILDDDQVPFQRK